MLTKVRRWFSADPREELKLALGDTPIPAFRGVVMEILKLLRDPVADHRKIGNAVAQDPGLSIRVLKLVNSPAYGLKRKVDNVPHAAALLGRNDLEEIVLALAVREALPQHAIADSSFWRIAARRAATARAIAQRIDPSQASLSFSGGLLQDLAVPMLASAKPDYLEIWQEAPGTRQLPELERQRYGWTHADVASWMCEAWSFPKPLRDAIEGHHTTADTAQIPVAVQVAALLEHHEDDPEALIEEGRDRFNLDPDLLELALHEGKEGGDRLAIAMAR